MALTIIPTAGQTLLVTRDPIKNNFQTISDAFAINHIEFNLADQGKHKFLSMPYQTTAPATAAGEMALYSNANVLYLKGPSSASGVAGTPIGGTGTSSFTSPGYTILPSGLKMYWGSVTTGNDGNGTFSYPTATPAGWLTFTSILSIQITCRYNVTPYVMNVLNPGLASTTVRATNLSGTAIAVSAYILILGV